MYSDFSELKGVLSDWPSKDICNETTDALFYKIFQILVESRSDDGALTSSADFFPLLRHVMFRHKARSHSSVNILVPKRNDWPQKEHWQNASFFCEDLPGDHFKVSPIPWSPEWSGLGAEDDIFKDIYLEKDCRPNLSKPIDPCVRDVSGFESYRSEGQRESVRGTFLAPGGATLVINLPTGSGKSLVGYLPSLLGKPEGNFTLFVVPTIALALDQERQLKDIYKKTKSSHIDTPLAWHSDLCDEDRKLIKKNIRNGSQPVLFTSPESVFGSLRWVLYESAKKNYLKYFVVDEAHLVSQWGVEFRPYFQSLSAVWRGLLQENGHQFKTLLMTATLTEETLEVLKTLFTDSNSSFQVVSGVHLRPEPQYWYTKATNSKTKEALVLDAIRMGVRPLILYETEPKNAEYWYRLLIGEGYHRIACFHGKTNNKRRKEIIDDWIADKIDIIVATSAFGVGMDKCDVRMILHATVPENLDRFYQEVGRGGRDGKASVSMLIYTDDDLKKAGGIAYPKVVSEELGMSRWEAMVNSQKLLSPSGDLYTIDLSTVPQYLERKSDYNYAWNMRTVLLMVRTGAVQLCAEPPPIENSESIEDLSDKEVEAYFNRVSLRYLDSVNHRSSSFWETTVADTRSKTACASQRNYELLRGVLTRKYGVGEALKQLYTIDKPGCFVVVNAQCGGCHVCRENDKEYSFFISAPVSPINKVKSTGNENWTDFFPVNVVHPVIVTYSKSEREILGQILLEVIPSLSKKFGVRELVFSSQDLCQKENEIMRLYRYAPDNFMIHRDLSEDKITEYSLPVPRVTILYPWDNQPLSDILIYSEKKFHLIFAPDEIKASDHPYRYLKDISSNTISLSGLRTRLA